MSDRHDREPVPQEAGLADIQVVLCPEPGRNARPLAARAVEVGAAGVSAVCEDLKPLPSRGGDRRVGTVLSAISETYGATPTVLLMRDGRALWSGAARILMVEMSAARGTVNLQMEFVQDLTVPQLACLGVG